MQRVALAAVVVILFATACAGGGSSSSTASGSTGKVSPEAPATVRPAGVRLAGGFGDEIGLAARFPSSWYAQPYGATTLLITSFPVHVDNGRFWQAIPAGRTAIEVFDQPSGSIRSCQRLRGAHGRPDLGRFEPNYEGFGAAFRNQFHDHGHTVLVFTSFGGRSPTRAQRLLAERILNSIQVDPRSCPVKDILAIGRYATRLNRLLTQAARRETASIHPRQGAYTPTLSTSTGPAGTSVTITGPIPQTGENGQPVRLTRLVVWWNLNTGYPSPAVTSRTPARPGMLIKLATIRLAAGQSHYRTTFTAPSAKLGSYPIVVLQEARDGSLAQLGSADFTLTATE